MGQRAILAAILVPGSTSSAQAISLVVMAVNSSPGVVGAKAFTLGIQITQADLFAPGVGAHPTLALHDLTFSGSTNGPVQAVGANNVPDIQTAWTRLDLNSPNSIGNGGAGGTSFPPGDPASATELYKDSWWYSSPTGTLQGINGFLPDESADTVGTVTTVNSGQGVYAQGPGAFVGTTGYLWSPQGTGIAGGGGAVGGVSQDMTYREVYGPSGANDLTAPPLANEFVNGILTIPLGQLVLNGNASVHVDFTAGQYLSFGQATYALPGVGVLNFASPSLVGANFVRVPEPSSCVLAALGLCGMLIAHRRRARRRTTDVSQV
jgi:hypothetical protein